MEKESRIEKIFREERQKALDTDVLWENVRPNSSPRAMRYIFGFPSNEYDAVPINFVDFKTQYALDERINVLSCSTDNNYRNRFNDFANRWNGARRNVPESVPLNEIEKAMPKELVEEQQELKEQLKPASLVYRLQNSPLKYADGKSETGDSDYVTLIFYDDSLAGKCRLTGVRDDTRGPSAAPYGFFVIDLKDGRRFSENWSAWEYGIKPYDDKRIRALLGEDTSTFELFDIH